MLEQRDSTPELMDGEEFDVGLAEASYRFIRRTNRLFGSLSAARGFLRRLLAVTKGREPLAILDLGAGACDIPIALCHWALRNNHAVKFTCLEKNSHAVHLATKWAAPKNLSVEIIETELFTFLENCQSSFDGALATLFLHHLSREEIDRLLFLLSPRLRGPLFVGDLRRWPPTYAACWLYTLGTEPGVRHDVLTSVRKGFTPKELTEILENHPAVSNFEIVNQGSLRLEVEVSFSPDPVSG